MIRKGIPPPLRCAVWMSNVIQSSHSAQDLAMAHEYRTLAKVEVIDGLYDSLWVDENSNSDGRTIRHTSLRRDDVIRLDLGNDTIWKEIDSYQEGNVRGCPGSQAMERILYALHKTVLGGVVDFAPLVPTLASILLGFMSESYAFYALREFFHHSTWYWAASRPEHAAYKRAFCDVLQKLHPSTAAVMAEQEQAEAYCEAIFRDFFTSIWPESLCLRIMDIYTLEGSKVSSQPMFLAFVFALSGSISHIIYSTPKGIVSVRRRFECLVRKRVQRKIHVYQYRYQQMVDRPQGLLPQSSQLRSVGKKSLRCSRKRRSKTISISQKTHPGSPY